MDGNKNRILQLSLEGQLYLLKRRLEHPDAAQWRYLGKIAGDFELWLERAQPLIPCAANLIALRVAQIAEGLTPGKASPKAVRQFLDLLNEAGCHLDRPGSPVQVIDLDPEAGVLIGGKDPFSRGAESSWGQGKIGLPLEMTEFPKDLQPGTDPSIPFRFIIPN